MKTINFKDENRGAGPGRAVDLLWDSWKILDKGTFSENEDSFTLTNQKGESFVAPKTNELFAAKMYNRTLSIDLKNFELFEGSNPSGGMFILYRFKDANRRNEFMISSIMGWAEGSSIRFEIN